MAKRKATNMRSPMLVPVELTDAFAEATGPNDPELAQRLINQVYETLWMPAELSDEERLQNIQSAIAACAASNLRMRSKGCWQRKWLRHTPPLWNAFVVQ